MTFLLRSLRLVPAKKIHLLMRDHSETGNRLKNTVVKEPIEIVEAKSAEDYAEGKMLIEEYVAALGIDLHFQNILEEVANLERIYGPPGGCLLLARYMSGVAGCVAIRRKESAVCEMKRLYVRPTHRGVGLGRKLAENAIECGRKIGYSRIFLDTLSSMTEAQSLYKSLGFRNTESYYENPLSGVRFLSLDIGAL